MGMNPGYFLKSFLLYKGFHQSKQHALRTYCPILHTVFLKPTNSSRLSFFFVSGKKPDEYNCSVEYYECVCILVASPSSPFQTYSLT